MKYSYEVKLYTQESPLPIALIALTASELVKAKSQANKHAKKHERIGKIELFENSKMIAVKTNEAWEYRYE